jgi:uncharacterized Ntn-hydrolase superfamily protein
MTFSIVARSADARFFGLAVASSSPAVAARCLHGRAGIGAVATQNLTDPSLGPKILTRLTSGTPTANALVEILQQTPFADYRQVLVIGSSGPPAVHTGAGALGIATHASGSHAAAGGNLLAHSEVPAAMVMAFEATIGHLGVRLLVALRAGLDRGGEAGPIHSAGLLVVRDVSWPIVDLRIDWSDADPVSDLRRLWDRYAPQIDDYVQRALDPAKAPSFGVRGDP